MKLDPNWRFDSPGEIPREVVYVFNDLVGVIASQRHRKSILEHFKRYFAGAYGGTASFSSNESWAESDLSGTMATAGKNAPLFIEAFYEGCEALRSDPDLALP